MASLNNAMMFLTTVISSRYLPTNNQLRTSSNPRTQANIQDDRVVVKNVPSYDSDILSKVLNYDNYHKNDMFNLFVQELPDFKQLVSVNDTYVDFLSDSNVISDNPDADNNEKEVVQDMPSLAQNDAILSLVVLLTYAWIEIDAEKHDLLADGLEGFDSDLKSSWQSCLLLSHIIEMKPDLLMILISCLSNVISDNPDADNNEKEVVQDMPSLAQNDAILSLIENMEHEVARYNTVNLESNWFKRSSTNACTGKICSVTTTFHEISDESSEVPERTTHQTSNLSPKNKANYEAEKEAIYLILTGIGDDIYSTFDACKPTHDMWVAIERHFGKECRKPKRAKDYMYHKEKILLCKQAEKGVPLQVEQADWLDETDEEIDEQELEAHYRVIPTTSVSRPQLKSNRLEDRIMLNNSKWKKQQLEDHHLEYVQSLRKEIDELESDKADFSKIYDLLLQECVSKDVMCSYLHTLSDLDAHTELQCLCLYKVKECECVAEKLSKQTENVSKEVYNELSRSFAKLEKHSISLELALQQCQE
uniref:Uncharacterized protein n=1 Tax=Tanacetum cinerariifolium TaxID=118510 RepID=A0A6L2P4J2_TANCI|nr:hypothetical protein [Tanacetum cinerariifolium]